MFSCFSPFIKKNLSPKKFKIETQFLKANYFRLKIYKITFFILNYCTQFSVFKNISFIKLSILDFKLKQVKILKNNYMKNYFMFIFVFLLE